MSTARRRISTEQLGFDTEAYLRRLRLLRHIVSGENQKEFARRLGISATRWNNLEQGYPMSRDMALLLMQRLPGMSVEWLWLGKTGNLSHHYATQVMRFESIEASSRREMLQHLPDQ
ncbi:MULTISPECIES: helix-turn-helix domain-containing protein [Bradyrhizobium]|uniref:helix-turn-helix domain-containing protein n=1 Tax=Bradyrhizobium TaxID=374 RepID=UPI002306D9DF|nr:helix-turn-helix transcriptional regulator [Bradyrhizobium sp. CCBAU 21362]MDA9539235.1 hypothetical protein [Bradyrhizobium sp. CCBAU 21362]